MMAEYQDVTEWLELVRAAIPTHDFTTPLIIVGVDVYQDSINTKVNDYVLKCEEFLKTWEKDKQEDAKKDQ
jgi:hypothetical protein